MSLEYVLPWGLQYVLPWGSVVAPKKIIPEYLKNFDENLPILKKSFQKFLYTQNIKSNKEIDQSWFWFVIYFIFPETIAHWYYGKEDDDIRNFFKDLITERELEGELQSCINLVTIQCEQWEKWNHEQILNNELSSSSNI
jgi:hypothetical protein